MSKSSTQFRHYLPRDSIRLHRLRAQSYKTTSPPSPQTLVANVRLLLHLCFWLISDRLELPTASSWGSFNLLEWFRELRETFIYIYQFIKNMIKDMNQEADEEMHRGGMAYMLSLGCHSPQSPSTQKRSEPTFFVLLWNHHDIVMID